MSALARWCFQHRFAVLLLWVVGMLGLGAAGNALGVNYANSFSLPGTESTKALTLLQTQLASQSGDQDTIVWQTSAGTVHDAQVESTMTATLGKIAKLPEVAGVRSPYDTTGAVQISKDGRTAYALVNFTKQANLLDTADITAVINTAQAASPPHSASSSPATQSTRSRRSSHQPVKESASWRPRSCCSSPSGRCSR
ncbi:MAG TPA: MMPL family transporter [Actinocrinis sp.]|nr:MMPL family transporter [Actinocrinis sp.]